MEETKAKNLIDATDYQKMLKLKKAQYCCFDHNLDTLGGRLRCSDEVSFARPNGPGS